MEIRDRIMQVAIQEFCKYGVRSVTMDDLAREMGVSKRTIYENFGDKKKLLMVSVEKLINDFKAVSCEMIDSADNVIQGLVQTFIHFYKSETRVSPQFHRDVKRHYPEVYELMCGEHHVRDFGVTLMLLEKGKTQGVFRDNLHMELVNSVLQRLFTRKEDDFSEIQGLTHKDVFRDLIFAYLAGIATDKGREIILREQDSLLDTEISTFINS